MTIDSSFFGFVDYNAGGVPAEYFRPMLGTETLAEFGTISIGIDRLEDTIQIGRPHVWPDGTVTWLPAPEICVGFALELIPLEDGLRQAALECFGEAMRALRGIRLDEHALRGYIQLSHKLIVERLRARNQVRELWRALAEVGAQAAFDQGVPRATIYAKLVEWGLR